MTTCYILMKTRALQLGADDLGCPTMRFIQQVPYTPVSRWPEMPTGFCDRIEAERIASTIRLLLSVPEAAYVIVGFLP